MSSPKTTERRKFFTFWKFCGPMLVELSTRKTISAWTASLQAVQERAKGIGSVDLHSKCLEPVELNGLQKREAMPENLHLGVLRHSK